MDLIFSVSGLRGVVGDGLDPESVVPYLRAFLRLTGPGRYLVGRDTRPHGSMVHRVVTGVLQALGATVVDAGVVPTPTVLFHVAQGNYAGGIVVTASHNPPPWNALKFVNGNGRFLSPAEVNQLRSLLQRQDLAPWAPWNRVGSVAPLPHAWKPHVDRILRTLNLTPTEQADEIRVAVDCVNGAMSEALPALLRALGFEVLPLYCDGSGRFPHNPEPRRENLELLNQLLQAKLAHLGFASDPDGDRLVFGLQGHGVFSEEYTLPVAVEAVLRRTGPKGPVVVNYSTSMMVEAVAQAHGLEVVRVPVGEIHVTEKLLETGGIIGGEGNGGVIFPQINATRDGLVAAALVATAYLEGWLIPFLQTLPVYTLLKTRIPRTQELDLSGLQSAFPRARASTEDGVYLRLDRAWVQVRPSNTEPIYRIFVEAPTPEEAQNLLKRVQAVLEPKP